MALVLVVKDATTAATVGNKGDAGGCIIDKNITKDALIEATVIGQEDDISDTVAKDTITDVTMPQRAISASNRTKGSPISDMVVALVALLQLVTKKMIVAGALPKMLLLLATKNESCASLYAVRSIER